MSLADRLKAYQAEQAAHQAAEAEAARRIAQEQQLQSSASISKRLAEERALRARILTELSPLLEVIDARRQLDDLRKIWATGKVDSEPKIDDTSITLAYSYQYWDIIDFHYLEEHYEFGKQSRHSKHIERNRDLYEVTVNQTPALYVTWRRPEKERTQCGEGIAIVSLKPDTYPKSSGWLSFDPSNPIATRKLLANTMFEYLKETPHPRQIKTEARERVLKSGLRNIPLGVRFQ